MSARRGLLVRLVWWDYLGILRFFLVLRKFNKDSIYSSLVVVMCSRFGDVSLFFLVGLNYYVGLNGRLMGSVVDFLVILIIFRKTAVYPFVPWLIEAMRAATAVRRLVHSATLVTAGVWFMSRYGAVFEFGRGMDLLLTSVVVLTIYIRAFLAFFRVDVKKLVAFSTCKNMRWCLLFCIFGYYEAALCQVFIHGILKCVCFVYIGSCMCVKSSVQLWSRFYSFLVSREEFLCACLILIGLGGFSCYGTYYVKHLIMILRFEGKGLLFRILI